MGQTEQAGEEPLGRREPPRDSGKPRGSLARFVRRFYIFFAWVALAVCLVMTLNCFILYHGSTFSQCYFGESGGEYGPEELIAVYNMVAGQCNELALLIERDESGMALYGGGMGRDGCSFAQKTQNFFAKKAK